MLDLRRLQLLRDVAATGTIAAAAQRAGCTAAAASQQLATLERELGIAVLERSARSVRLTEAGRVLVEHADRLFADLTEAERAVQEVAGLRGGRLRVAAFATAGVSFVVPAMARFRRRHPQVRLSLVEMDPDEALPAVRAGGVDMAVTFEYAPLTRPDLRGLSQLPLYGDPLLLAIPRQRNAPAPARVRLADYAGSDWIAARAPTGLHAVTEEACRSAGFQPRISARVHSYSLALAMVAGGFGVTIVPRLAAEPHRDVVLAPIGRPSGLVRQIYATTRAVDRSPAIAQLSRCLTEVLTEPGSPVNDS
ncbi:MULTISPECIES: LysR family transcriptional regulator [unclassified Kribbella]|uniref:LysR family transcriptional regulator n=1 Tax=unclassified Kribbella TaxID=2644121 RepID=UPI00301A972D